MVQSYNLLKSHPVNLDRIKRGKRPANSIWLWGEGQRPRLDSFESKFHKKGSVVSAVDLIKGIGLCAKMSSVDVDGATGYIDTNFTGKMEAALQEFRKGQDFVYIHVEAPDECGHRGEMENKIKAIELIDEKILTPLTAALREAGPFPNHGPAGSSHSFVDQNPCFRSGSLPNLRQRSRAMQRCFLLL